MRGECCNFNGYTIGDEGASLIADTLISNNLSPTKKASCKEIKLTKSRITDEGFIKLSEAFYKCLNITSINLSKNKLKDQSYENIIELIKVNKNLKLLNLSQNNFTYNVKEKIKNCAKIFNSNLKLEI